MCLPPSEPALPPPQERDPSAHVSPRPLTTGVAMLSGSMLRFVDETMIKHVMSPRTAADIDDVMITEAVAMNLLRNQICHAKLLPGQCR